MAIRYPTNYNSTADIPADLEDMAESIQDELDLKVDKVTGKGLSTEDYTTAEKTKLDGIESGAEENVIEDVKVNGTSLTPSSKAVDVPVPTKTSDLTNDSGFIDKDVNNLTNYYDKNAVDTKIASVYKYKGTVSTYNDLPSSNLTVGDVYNIETADSTHGIKAGDNVAWTGTTWDVLAGTVDLSGKEDKTNKVTSINSSSTNTQYPSAKLLYDQLAEKQAEIDGLVAENSIIKKQFPTAHISTTSTQLTDSAEGLPIENVKLKGQTSQATDEYVYICDGTETGDYYFEYNNTNYQFTMPTISEGDALVFDGTKLTLDETEITTTTDNTGTLITLQQTPNPAYPQLIHRVTGNCNEKFVNKNLFDTQYFIEHKNDFFNAYNGYFYALELDDKFKKQITASISLKEGQEIITGVALAFTTSYGSSPGGNTRILTTDGTIKNITYDFSEAEHVYLQVGASVQGTAFNRLDDIFNVYSIQLEKGSTASSYVPHSEQNAPLSLGNTELYEDDEIEIDYVQKAGYKKVTGARLVQNMGKKTFSNEDVFYSVSEGYYMNFKVKATTPRTLLCNRYVNKVTYSTFMASDYAISMLYSSTQLYIRDKDVSSASELLQKLINNNTEIIYKLATPVITPITDTTFLAQLETLINMKTYKEITNIESTGTDLAPVLDCDYYQDISTLRTELATINARLDLLEE